MADENTEVILRYSREDWELLYVNPLVRMVNLKYNMPAVCFSVGYDGSREDVHVTPFTEFLKKPLEEMPLYVNDDFLWRRVLCRWRLMVAK